MTNLPGEGTPPERPEQPRPGEQPGTGQPGEYQPGYWEQQPGQQPGQQPPYPQPGYPAQPVQYAPDHPRATTSLVLGILGLFCGVVAPFAWWIGKKTLDEIDASQGRVGGRGAAQAGYVLGIVGSVLLILGVVLMVIYVIGMIALFSTSGASY